MCYSALIKQSIKKLGLKYSARVDLALFEELAKERLAGKKRNLPKGIEEELCGGGVGISLSSIDEMKLYRKQQLEKLEKDLFQQKSRKEKALEGLKSKSTKTLEKEVNVASRQMERILERIRKLQRTQSQKEDFRIFSMDYAPVIIWKNGERWIVPMRYHLRPSGMKEDFDRKYPGCYNARRDSLMGFWKNQFGTNHGLLVIESFFEHVSKADFEGKKNSDSQESIVIEFRPDNKSEMLVPCIWDRWEGQDSFHSFAIITDDPPPEVLARGHDRCPIFLRQEVLDAWLNPKGKTQEELLTILQSKEAVKYLADIA